MLLGDPLNFVSYILFMINPDFSEMQSFLPPQFLIIFLTLKIGPDIQAPLLMNYNNSECRAIITNFGFNHIPALLMTFSSAVLCTLVYISK